MPENTSTRLKQIMSQRGLRQVDILRMAEPYCKQYQIKLGKSDLSQFVKGVTSPGQWKLTILGLALNVSEAWLMGFDVPMERKSNPTPQTCEENDKNTVKETQLLQKYRSLPPEGQEAVNNLVDNLYKMVVSSPKSNTIPAQKEIG
jgi:hypothetical protein